MKILLFVFVLSASGCGYQSMPVAEAKKSQSFRGAFALSEGTGKLAIPPDLMAMMLGSVFTGKEVLAKMGADYSRSKVIRLGRALKRHGFDSVFADFGGEKRMVYFVRRNPQLQEVLVDGEVPHTGTEGRKDFLTKLREIQTGRVGLISATTVRQSALLSKIDELPAYFIQIMHDSVFTGREVLEKMGMEYSRAQANYLGKVLKKSDFGRVKTYDFGVNGGAHEIYFARHNPQLKDLLIDGMVPQKGGEGRKEFFAKIREMYASRFDSQLVTTSQQFALLNELESMSADFMMIMHNGVFTGREALTEMGREYSPKKARVLGVALKKLDFDSVRLYVDENKITVYFSQHNPQLRDILIDGKVPLKSEKGRKALLAKIKEMCETRGWL